MKGPLFYSKILLFGEYGIIKDSKGLSIPYNFFKGALKWDNDNSEMAQKSNKSLKAYAEYLKVLEMKEEGLVAFDIAALEKDVADGMYFDSSIPQGYGIGSSGALVAAIYDRYAMDKITVLENLTREKLLQL
ncbi:MAG TPA: mevalonate kinase, partial [Muricauda sp.]|nr:mevalonate kinase [Allomuricauda sp.]